LISVSFNQRLTLTSLFAAEEELIILSLMG